MQINTDGRIWKSFITLQDTTTPTSNALFSGSKVYVFAHDETIGGNTKAATQSINLPPYADYVGSHVGSVWETQKGRVSYAGANNHEISLNATWLTNIGSYASTGEPILTPYKLFLMATSGRTFRLRDERIIEQMALESGSQLYYNGMDVAFAGAYSFKASSTDENRVTMSVALREDR